MSFQYSKKWADELLSLALLKHPFAEEEKKFLELLFIAENTKDIRAVKKMILSLKNSGSGRDQTIYGVLGSIDYKIYYEAVFILADEFLSLDKEEAIILLDWNGRDLLDSEFSTVSALVDDKLSNNQISKYLELMERYGYVEGVNNKSTSDFLTLFKNKASSSGNYE